MPTDSTSWSGRPVTLWRWSWTLWQKCQTGGCCRSCGRYCSMAPTLHNALVKQRSTFSQRLIAPKCITEHHRKSFLPAAIKLYNSSLWWSDSNRYRYLNMYIYVYSCIYWTIEIVVFIILFYCLLSILFKSLYLSLISIHSFQYFYFYFAWSIWNKNNFSPGNKKAFWFRLWWLFQCCDTRLQSSFVPNAVRPFNLHSFNFMIYLTPTDWDPTQRQALRKTKISSLRVLFAYVGRKEASVLNWEGFINT